MAVRLSSIHRLMANQGEKICKNMQYKHAKAVVSTLVIPAVRTKHVGASHKRGFRPHGSQDLDEQSGSMQHGAITSALLLRCADLGAE